MGGGNRVVTIVARAVGVSMCLCLLSGQGSCSRRARLYWHEKETNIHAVCVHTIDLLSLFDLTLHTASSTLCCTRPSDRPPVSAGAYCHLLSVILQYQLCSFRPDTCFLLLSVYYSSNHSRCVHAAYRSLHQYRGGFIYSPLSYCRLRLRSGHGSAFSFACLLGRSQTRKGRQHHERKG
jgi:hypothetical protein